ncbi:probable acetyl-CoA C-acyltransferase (3-ketoacyl-CoA thiolase) (plasmid) [Rhodococcus jostii RHA1]|uniref:Probable acetyl-CoA C-acyltransferase (3-ketoacyl-CoA thiolase) n=1 Tax=Rhodococcus jostii (strain RHA1) TaxID=101510 RepID=Q0RV54_RHOJR|nr:thiolase family protein [Rhodococcus jostii]ABH00832.1 probable acetyl-CoA C-acyltransferase (3-ketoacyl-CoA thiolase) [Rhodococcus jostii RHA1]
MTPFGKFPTENMGSLGRDAGLSALGDANVRPHDVEMISCGSARSGILHSRESGVGQLVGWEIGIEGVAVYNEKAYCASGSIAFNVANMAVASGTYDVALVIGVEQMSRRDGKGRPLTSDGMLLEGEQGFTPPAYYAMAARRHMEHYGTTREQIAAVAVKNRRAAALNPKAQYRTPITMEDVLSAKHVVGPLHLLDCCPTGDGAAAAVIVSERGAERLGIEPGIQIGASVIGSGFYRNQTRDMTSFGLDRSTSRQAYDVAGVGPADIDVAEVHDSFSIAEIIHYEDLGFCEPGMGGKFVESGETSLGGKIPVNTGGGLLNRGHPLGATGVAQIVELADQLLGRAGDRQVPSAQTALAHISGGFHESDFATSGVTILKKIKEGAA